MATAMVAATAAAMVAAAAVAVVVAAAVAATDNHSDHYQIVMISILALASKKPTMTSSLH
jgi:hypothetical protein